MINGRKWLLLGPAKEKPDLGWALHQSYIFNIKKGYLKWVSLLGENNCRCPFLRSAWTSWETQIWHCGLPVNRVATAIVYKQDGKSLVTRSYPFESYASGMGCGLADLYSPPLALLPFHGNTEGNMFWRQGQSSVHQCIKSVSRFSVPKYRMRRDFCSERIKCFS